MKITLILVGKTEESYLKEGIEKYIGRLKHYIHFQFVILPESKQAKNLSQAQQKEKEGLTILAQISSGDTLLLLDEKGKQFRSVEFAAFLNKHMIASTQHLVFVIGGPYGFSESVYKRATGTISLSAMTFSHQMIRLLFVEQLYRAFSILRNEPYHHE